MVKMIERVEFIDLTENKTPVHKVYQDNIRLIKKIIIIMQKVLAIFSPEHPLAVAV